MFISLCKSFASFQETYLLIEKLSGNLTIFSPFPGRFQKQLCDWHTQLPSKGE